MSVDCLFLHIPHFRSQYKPIGKVIFINIMPMGLLALADWMHRAGFSVRVVHAGAEWFADRRYRITDSLYRYRPKVVAMPLHWHYQSYEVVEASKIIKSVLPDTKVLLGGYTAGYFNSEILDEVPSVDAVIQGDAEEPLRRYLEVAVRSNGSYSAVPNLHYREDGQVSKTDMSYCTSQETFDQLDYTNFALMDNFPMYRDHVSVPFFFLSASLDRKTNSKMITTGMSSFYLSLARGCSFNCAYCGGSHRTQVSHFNRKKSLVRDPASVLSSIETAVGNGYQSIYVCNEPDTNQEDYFLTIFDMIRERELSIIMFFENHRVPSRRFAEAFKATFPSKKSRLIISPDTANETLRRKVKGCSYTNAELYQSLDDCESLGVRTMLFYSYGLPFEKEEDIFETLRIAKAIKKRYKYVYSIRLLTIEMEPGSPWYIDPERYGIVTNRRSFMDFYQTHGRLDTSTLSTLGYYIPGFFSDQDRGNSVASFEEEISRLRCKHFCWVSLDPYGSSFPPINNRLLCPTVTQYTRFNRWLRKITGRTSELSEESPIGIGEAPPE